MKKARLIVLSLLVLMAFSINALAQDRSEGTSGFYVGVLGGVAFPKDLKTTLIGEGYSDRIDFSLNNAWLAGAKVGYITDFSNRILAFELEYNHTEGKFDSGKLYMGILTVDNKIKTDSILVNLIARYPDGRFHPYVGIGGGYANVTLDDFVVSATGAGNVFTLGGASKGVLAYQALIGLDIEITRNWILGLGYKYFAANKVSFDIPVNIPGFASESGTVEAEYVSPHNITLSISYLF